MVSAVAYTLWSVLLAWNDVSKVAIFGFVNPLCGVILSALILGEVKQAFNIGSLAALILVCAGIYIVNCKENKRNNCTAMEHTTYRSKKGVCTMAVDFSKSKTRENLMRAFAGESQARNRYTIAAKQASRDNLYSISQIFYLLQIRSGHTRKCFMNY